MLEVVLGDDMRIISGSLKGRQIKGFNIEGTRPTMDRVKASIFASIQSDIKDSIVLDLFAGSGNLGIEAISNGSKYCYFIDNNKKCTQCIKDNLKMFHIDKQCQVVYMDYNRALKKFRNNNQKFDIIFVDPPYKYENINDVVDVISNYNILNKNGLLILEFKYDSLVIDSSIYTLHKSKRYGDKFVYIYKKIID